VSLGPDVKKSWFLVPFDDVPPPNSMPQSPVMVMPWAGKSGVLAGPERHLNYLLIRSRISRAYSSPGLPGDDLLLCSGTGGSCQWDRA
jgi:hypothetical protein